MQRMMRMMLMSFALMVCANMGAQDKDWGNLQRYAQQNAEVRQLPQEQRSVVFMGNSITENWARMRPQFFSSNGYVGRGISGQTSYQFVVRFRQDVIDLQPQVVVINVATNDVAENTGPYDEDRTMGNIMTMVELAQAHGIKVILTSTLPAAKFGWRPQITDAAEKIARLNKRIEAYANEKDITYVDYYAKMVKDGVHPTVAGYEVMEPMIKKAIETVIATDSTTTN